MEYTEYTSDGKKAVSKLILLHVKDNIVSMAFYIKDETGLSSFDKIIESIAIVDDK